MRDQTRGSNATPPDLVTALREGAERYEALLRRTGYGIYRSTASGRFLEVNSVLVAMLGYDSSDELLTVDIARDVYLDPDERERLSERRDVDFPEWVETRWKRRDGTPVNVRISARARYDANGTVQSWDGIVQDITERQRNDELRRRSERMASIGTTLAGVAHELNNPLAAIIGFTQLLLKKTWPAEDRSALETINHEAIRSATIVKDLLALARERDVERRVRTDVNDVVGYIMRTRRYALESHNITCRVELDPTVPAINGDRAQLEQVIINLLNNAEHALTGDTGARAGRIGIRTSHDEHDVIIEVEDDGPGIPEEARPHIWDPFWTTKDEGEGTGLGLAVVHGIVNDHAGTISLEDGSANGARFVIRLPIARDTLTPPRPSHALRPLDVLVVDPGASDLHFVERFLTSRGHAVINAGSGELALRLADQSSFDAVVCDARLLGRGGKSIAESLRESPGCAGARFVLAIPSSLDDQPLPTNIAGATIVSRPYDVEELRRLIEGD